MWAARRRRLNRHYHSPWPGLVSSDSVRTPSIFLMALARLDGRLKAAHGEERSEQLTNRRFQFLGPDFGRIARHRIAITVDQEFGEIPFDHPGAQKAALAAFEMVEQLVGARAIDLQLGEHGKGDAEILAAETGDLAFAAQFLVHGLVAGKA